MCIYYISESCHSFLSMEYITRNIPPKTSPSKLKVYLSYIPTICFNSQGCFIFQKLLCKTLFFVLIPSSAASVHPSIMASFTPFISLPFGLLSLICSNLPSVNSYLAASTTSPAPQEPFSKNCFFPYPWY